MTQQQTMLATKCPSCGQRMKAPSGLLGKTSKCVKCGEHFLVTNNNSRSLNGNGPAAAQQKPEKGKQKSADGPSDTPIAAMLVGAGLVNERHVHEAEAIQSSDGGRIYEILIDKGHLKKETFDDWMSRQQGLASIELKNYRIDESLLGLVPPEFALDRLVLPIDKLGRLLTLAMACPLESETIDHIQKSTGLRVHAMLCNIDDIREALHRYFPEGGAVKQEEEADFSWLTGPEGGSNGKPAESPRFEGKPAPKTGAASKTARQKAAAPAPADAELIRKREALMEELAEAVVLPASAQQRQRLQSLAAAANPPVRDLTMASRQDPALALSALRVANSSVYGLGGRVENCTMAGILIGGQGLGRVLASAMDVESPSKENFAHDAFVSRCRMYAQTAERLAQLSGKTTPAACHTVGLLAGIGELALASIRPGEFAKAANEGELTEAGARKIFGVDRQEAAYCCARGCCLPDALAEALRLARQPEEAAKAGALAAAVALAVLLVDSRLHGKGLKAASQHVRALARLNLQEHHLAQAYEEISALRN